VAAAVMFAELFTAGANRSVVPVPFRNIDRSNYNQSSGRATTCGGARWRKSWGR